ncbi:MAG: 1-acyl-sn-glycerol-3-phosphate acyltransferase [Paludibacter sp.]|jgi:putative hemolysin|nr:1-acyl-sn-glycerol-3-phosphate acyltransferase [Paludibacter sp.]
MSEKDIIKIDVAGVLKARAPKTKVPKFVINYLRRIVHEDQFNKFFRENPDLKNIAFIEAAFKFMDIKLVIEGEENLPPKDGKYIFASNHPLGGLDGIATGYVVGKHYDGKVRFFSNDLLMFLTPMKEMFVPVNKFGGQGKGHAEMMQQLYESENHLVTYPAGICSRKQKGQICDLEWKKNFITKAVQYKRDVVPVYFEGRNSQFFYNLANLRKFLGIKFNIEMMFLADEMFKQKGKHFVLKFGKPIPWQTFDRSKSHAEWAEWVKDIVYKMK